jgi:hypothetical protein
MLLEDAQADVHRRFSVYKNLAERWAAAPFCGRDGGRVPPS